MAIGGELGHFASALTPPGDTRVRWRSGDRGWLRLIVPSALSDSFLLGGPSSQFSLCFVSVLLINEETLYVFPSM